MLPRKKKKNGAEIVRRQVKEAEGPGARYFWRRRIDLIERTFSNDDQEVSLRQRYAHRGLSRTPCTAQPSAEERVSKHDSAAAPSCALQPRGQSTPCQPRLTHHDPEIISRVLEGCISHRQDGPIGKLLRKTGPVPASRKQALVLE